MSRPFGRTATARWNLRGFGLSGGGRIMRSTVGWLVVTLTFVAVPTCVANAQARCHVDSRGRPCITPGPKTSKDLGANGTLWSWSFTNSSSCNGSIDIYADPGDVLLGGVAPGKSQPFQCTQNSQSKNCPWSGWKEICRDSSNGGASDNAPNTTSNSASRANKSTNDTPRVSEPGAKVNFDFAERINTKEVWQGFLRDYPDSPYADTARKRLQQLLENTQLDGQNSATSKGDKLHIVGQVRWTESMVRREWTHTRSGTNNNLVFIVDGNRLTVPASDGTLVCGLNAPISQSVPGVALPGTSGGGPPGTVLCSFSRDGNTIRMNRDGTAPNKYGGAPFHEQRRFLISIDNKGNCTISGESNSDGDTAVMHGRAWTGHFSHYTTHTSGSGTCQVD
jgi:hypothetical protein